MKRLSYLAAAGLFAATLGAAPVGAQPNTSSSDCTQSTTGAGGLITPAPQDNRGNGSAAALGGVISALINANALNNVDVAANLLNSSPVELVCLNDALNQNDVRLLTDVLNNSPILNDSLNNAAQNALQNADIALLNNVQVVAVNLGPTPQIFLLRR